MDPNYTTWRMVIIPNLSCCWCTGFPSSGTPGDTSSESSLQISGDGPKLHYVENGDNTKPLMLLVHGFPEFWYSWRHQLREFSSDFWCVPIM
ncbi:Epoxide hydrolase 4 [Homalodisca vitripennis]|nr:Epoxide hydrolase 4 [Homalodisca vitripennis]